MSWEQISPGERLTCPDCIANFPAAFDTDFMAVDAPGLSSTASVSMTDPLLVNMVELDEWITVKSLFEI